MLTRQGPCTLIILQQFQVRVFRRQPSVKRSEKRAVNRFRGARTDAAANFSFPHETEHKEGTESSTKRQHSWQRARHMVTLLNETERTERQAASSTSRKQSRQMGTHPHTRLPEKVRADWVLMVRKVYYALVSPATL